MANDYAVMDERSLLLALELSALAATEAMRDGRMDDWSRETRIGAEVHEVLATRYGWRTTTDSCRRCGVALNAENVWEPGTCRACAPGCMRDWQCAMGTDHAGPCDWGDDDS